MRKSTEEKPELIKEHIFVLSDDNTQDYHCVHHSQKLIFDYITKELNLQIKKVHEFTDGCAGQYKLRHTFGELSCSLADFGFQVDHHFFEASHAKGEQDAAGANIKQRATLAVLRRETSITSAKDLCEYLSRTLRNPTSQSESVTLKKRVFFYVPVDGEGTVPRGRQGHTFKEFQGIRKIHCIKTTPEQCKQYTRLCSCTCFECLDGSYEECENSAMVDGWQEVRLTSDGEVSTRPHSEAAGGDRVNALTDLIEGNSIVAITAEEDNYFDYYLLKLISSGAVVLESD